MSTNLAPERASAPTAASAPATPALRCACAGDASAVPLGAVSLMENLAMVGMALRTLAK